MSENVIILNDIKNDILDNALSSELSRILNDEEIAHSPHPLLTQGKTFLFGIKNVYGRAHRYKIFHVSNVCKRDKATFTNHLLKTLSTLIEEIWEEAIVEEIPKQAPKLKLIKNNENNIDKKKETEYQMTSVGLLDGIGDGLSMSTTCEQRFDAYIEEEHGK